MTMRGEGLSCYVQLKIIIFSVPAVRTGQGLVTQGTGLHVRGEIFIKFSTVRTHSLICLHIRSVGFPACLGLRLLRFVLVSVVVPDVTTQTVVCLEMLPTEFTNMREVLVELLEVLIKLAAATADLPVVVLELVTLEQLRLEEDLGAETAGVLVVPGLPVVLHDAAGVDGDPGWVERVDVAQQLLPAGVPLPAQSAAEVLLRPLLALQLLTGLVGVEVTEVTGEGIVGFEFLLTNDANVFQVLEIFLEILIVLVAAAAVGLTVELELVFLKQLELRETYLRNENLLVKIFQSNPATAPSPYKYHRC